ncbi:MAG: S8 family serine peptidase [Bdellovibrionales bacterium]|nr:S8 family serine peptidase [Bdellovibrionales bacterium]
MKSSVTSILCGLMLATGAVGNVAVAATPEVAQISNVVKKELAENGKAEVLIVLKSQADLSGARAITDRVAKLRYVYQTLVAHANKTQPALLSLLAQKVSKQQVQRFFITNAILVRGADTDLVKTLAARPDVHRLAGNPATQMQLPWETEGLGAATVLGVGDNLTATGADRVWKEFNDQGQNIVIGGQDTGYQWDHPALKNAYRGFKNGQVMHDYNWHDSIHSAFNKDELSGAKKNSCGYNLAAPCDDDRHGTHTMGTMVGNDGGANQIGMAPQAKWIGCRNMDGGVGKPATYLECFQFFLAPTKVGGDPFTGGKPEYAPHVINNSWGCPSDEGCKGDEFLPALKALYEANVMVVVSAGNDGPGCSTIKDQPATHSQYTLTVGAYNHRNGNIASFSSRGPSAYSKMLGPDVVAPGVSIRSSVPGNGYDQAMWSGTSMAGPHVVGAVALIWSANPKYIGKIDATKDLLHKSALGKTTSENCGGVSGSQVPNNTYGHGIMRVYDAVKTALGRK